MSEAPKWPRDHHDKHAAAARKGWKTRRSRAALPRETRRERMFRHRVAEEASQRTRNARGLSARAKAPVRRAIAEEERRRKTYKDTITRKDRGRATWDEVDNAERAWKSASKQASQAAHTYYEKYGIHYVN